MEVKVSLSSIDLDRLKGLEPKTWLCIDSGFSREEFKEILFKEGVGFVKDALMSPEELCIKIVQPTSHKPLTVLGPLARQEVLRTLLSERRISRNLPELKKLRRQRGFFKKLDRSLQSARKCFAHAEEEGVLEEKLVFSGGQDPRRTELRNLNQAYEAWMGANGYFDFPLLMREATRLLDSHQDLNQLPEEIILYSAVTPESLEQSFWEALSKRIKVQRRGPLQEFPIEFETSNAESLQWELWHTLDDAAQSLAERLAQDPGFFENQVILIPDFASVRRTVVRALDMYSVPLLDPRDPMLIRMDEKFKWALLPLDVVASRYERVAVLSWLRYFFPKKEIPKVELEINALGIRRGFESYRGLELENLCSRLKELNGLFGGRRSCEELAEAHLKVLRIQAGEDSFFYGLITFFEKFWDEFQKDLQLVGREHVKAPALYWLEQVRARLENESPPVDPLKPKTGVVLHRLGQAPIPHQNKIKSLWILGAPSDWMKAEGTGDLWFTERARECLASEFSVRSRHEIRQERSQILKSWIQQSEKVVFLDARYDMDGTERESLLPLLKTFNHFVPLECGAHSRFLKSYGSLKFSEPIKIELPSLEKFGKKEIRATDLDHYSRCGFRGLAASRWKLWDIRDPGIDLWPEVRGNILHGAVQILTQNKDATPREALEMSLARERPRGLLQGKRLAKVIRAELLAVLENFNESEKSYAERSGVRLFQTEGPKLHYDCDKFSITGIPDRIDEHPDGIFIIDYKTSSSLAKGKEMLEDGYRLQLPFYAIAASKTLARTALGAQFVELNRTGGRGQGIFLKKWNGKEGGKLTDSRSLLSVLDGEPEEIWSRFEEHIQRESQEYFQGRFHAQPKKKTECRSCPFGDLCGRRRFGTGEFIHE